MDRKPTAPGSSAFVLPAALTPLGVHALPSLYPFLPSLGVCMLCLPQDPSLWHCTPALCSWMCNLRGKHPSPDCVLTYKMQMMRAYDPRATRRTNCINVCDAITADLAQSSFSHPPPTGSPESGLTGKDGEEKKSPDHQKWGPSGMAATRTRITRCVTLAQLGSNQLPFFSRNSRGTLFSLLLLSSTRPNACIVFSPLQDIPACYNPHKARR